jgi:hypothetical protein
MKSHIAIGLALLFGAVVAAGEGGAHEEVIKQMTAAIDKLGAALEGVQDEDTAKAIRPDLKKHAGVFVEARKKAEKLPPPEAEEKDRLTKELKPKLEEAMKKLFTQVRRVERLPGGQDALLELRPVLNKNGKSE